ncbi:MAG: protein-L-isoaspartate(D-aspartate) O-methyltransferase [Roseibium sp.]
MAGLNPGEAEAHNHSALPDEAEARAALVLGLRRRGIGALNVLSAIELVPRRLFLSARHHGLAYEDAILPIECGQTISAPSLVAFMVQALQVSQDHRVLEIGTGSGYQSAVLSHLAGQVETLDRYKTLTDLSKSRFAALKLENVRAHHANGFDGLKSKGPYDRIVVNGAVNEIPDPWIQQLRPGGLLIAPVGLAKQPQELIRYQKGDNVLSAEDLMNLKTVMLQPGLAHKL